MLGAQQDSGTAAVRSRSDFGEITAQDWAPVAGFEYGYIVAGPTNPDIVYVAALGRAHHRAVRLPVPPR